MGTWPQSLILLEDPGKSHVSRFLDAERSVSFPRSGVYSESLSF